MFDHKSVNLGKVLKIFLLFAVVSYLSYHIFYGNRGLFALIQYDNKYQQILNDLENLRAERIGLEHKVKLLKTSSLDLDVLEELAKEKLSLIKENEIVLYTEE
jgi:cell division protein FtsB